MSGSEGAGFRQRSPATRLLIAASHPHSRPVAALLGHLERAIEGLHRRCRQGCRDGEGRKSHAELRPDVMALAKRLHRASSKTGKHRSLREITAGLVRTGHRNECGKPYAAQSVKVMLRPEPDVITRCPSSVCAEPAAGTLNRFVPRQFH